MKKTKKGKIVFWIIFTIIAITLYFQNRSFFMYEHNDNLNLDIVVLDFSISPMPMAIFFIAFFLIGYFIAFCFGLIEKHRMKKTIQELNSKLNEQDKKLGSLINEADSLKVRRQESNQPKADDGPDSKEKDLSGALGNPKKES